MVGVLSGKLIVTIIVIIITRVLLAAYLRWAS
jgi:hypothetical protein